MAEATVYVATRTPVNRQESSTSNPRSCPLATRSGASQSGTPLVSYGEPQSPTIRGSSTPRQVSSARTGTVGEIWLHGDNVAAGYWQKPTQTEHTFRWPACRPSADTPEGPWLRTGDLGFFSEGELFIVGRIKDLLIVYGRNHSPDDIEATIQEITPGRCAAIAVPDEGTEQLVVIIEVKNRGDSDEDAMDKLDIVKREVTSAISTLTASPSRISFWCRRVPFRSPPAARSGERPVSSNTGRISSSAWTRRVDCEGPAIGRGPNRQSVEPGQADNLSPSCGAFASLSYSLRDRHQPPDSQPVR